MAFRKQFVVETLQLLSVLIASNEYARAFNEECSVYNFLSVIVMIHDVCKMFALYIVNDAMAMTLTDEHASRKKLVLGMDVSADTEKTNGTLCTHSFFSEEKTQEKCE